MTDQPLWHPADTGGMFAKDADLTVHWPAVRPCWEEPVNDRTKRPHSHEADTDVWMPIFGWVTREQFDQMLPPLPVASSPIAYRREAD